MVSVRLACVCPAGLSQRCVLENRRFEYEISREAGGGSGGEEYRLIAAEAVDGHCLVYGQIKQSEHGDLKFELWNRRSRTQSFIRPPLAQRLAPHNQPNESSR